MNHRATDGPHQGKFWVSARRAYRVWTDLVPLIALGIALYAVVESAGNVRALEAESHERRDQSCVVFERDTIAAKTAYVTAKQQLTSTQDYLHTLSPAERRTGINQAIVASLPRLKDAVDVQWRNARATAAPVYCDEPGIGLEEPNPALPDKP